MTETINTPIYPFVRLPFNYINMCLFTAKYHKHNESSHLLHKHKESDIRKRNEL